VIFGNVEMSKSGQWGHSWAGYMMNRAQL